VNKKGPKITDLDRGYVWKKGGKTAIQSKKSVYWTPILETAFLDWTTILTPFLHIILDPYLNLHEQTILSRHYFFRNIWIIINRINTSTSLVCWSRLSMAGDTQLWTPIQSMTSLAIERLDQQTTDAEF
jgi:hypothetical protein